MSIIGIDVGSSSIKAAAYRDDGKLLALVRADLTPHHLQPGWWEQDPDEVWQTTLNLVHQLMQEDNLQRDIPKALAISASVRDVFPADQNGNPLDYCIMAADVRGAEFENPPDGVVLPEEWSQHCGHVRNRMDPFNRLLWWRKNKPKTFNKARYFLGWHEFLSMRMCGLAVVDRSIAGHWMVFDLHSQEWSTQRLAEYEISPSLLPEILPWGTVVGYIKKEILDHWGAQHPIKLAVGISDLNGSALGAGVIAIGDACVVSGSFENLLIPTSGFPTTQMLLRGLSVTSHPGSAGKSIWAPNPTGTAVINWVRKLTSISLRDLDTQLNQIGFSPSPVLAIPYLSGAFTYWQGGRNIRGSIHGLTLANEPIDVIQAFMESIAYDHVNTLSLLADEGVVVKSLRATGGGSRSVWWTQLKSNMTGLPIKVIEQTEPGTLGAALLAGLAIGEITNLNKTSRLFAGISRIHEPNLEIFKLHREKLAEYRNKIEGMLQIH